MAQSSESRLQALEWGAIAVIVVVWGVNNVAAKFATEVLPPLFTAGVRFSIALVMLAPFLRPPLPPLKPLLPVMLLVGPLHFGLIYVGFHLVHNVSLLGVTLQLWVPLTALFAWWLLRERINALALAGIAVAFAGSAWMTLDPKLIGDGVAVLFGLGASICWSIGTVLIRRLPPMPSLRIQGLVSLLAAPMLLAASFAVEPNVSTAVRQASVWVWLSVAFAGVVSTVGASALLFWLIQRRPTGQVTPYLLASPLVTAAVSTTFLGEQLTPRLIVGGLASLAGVATVTLSERRRAREADKAAATAPPT